MKRVGVERSFEEQIQYHLDDGRAPWFIDSQRGRIELARFLLDKVVREVELMPTPETWREGNKLRIVELGCGAGDITGPLAGWHDVVGVDVTQEALRSCGERWPDMTFLLSPVEQLDSFECDILVMTEFLEHVEDPEKIVRDWMPKARWAIIGHPLDEPDPPLEPGHIWSYTREDWRNWFKIGGHQWWEEFRFPMGGWDAMVLGHSSRVIKPL